MLPDVNLSVAPTYLQFLWFALDALLWGVCLAVVMRLLKPFWL